MEYPAGAAQKEQERGKMMIARCVFIPPAKDPVYQ